MSDIFDGVEDVEEGSKDPYVIKGRYLCAIEDVKYIEKSKKDKVPVYIGRWRIIRSNNPLRPPGSTMAWIVKLKDDTAIDLKRKDVALHAAAAYRCDHKKITGEVVRGTWHAEQPLRGKVIEVDAFDITTTAGNPFTKCSFSVPKVSDAELFAELEHLLRNPAAAPIPDAAPAKGSAPWPDSSSEPPPAARSAPPASRGPVIPI